MTTDKLKKLQLKSQASERAYRDALSGLRAALATEKDELDNEIRFYEDIEGCLTISEDKAYDALLDRFIHVSNQLHELYH